VIAYYYILLHIIRIPTAEVLPSLTGEGHRLSGHRGLYIVVAKIAIRFVTSSEELMFSLALVCSLAGLCKNYFTDFNKTWWKGGTWATEETSRF